MKRLSQIAVVALGLSGSADAYKVRRWADMVKKQPANENLLKELVQKYDFIYTMAWKALQDADGTDGLKIKERFGIDLSEKQVQGNGYDKLLALAQFAKNSDWNVDEKGVKEQWTEKLRDAFDTIEKEMLSMNAALSFAAGYVDLNDANQASILRNIRKEFREQGKEFERGPMWALRSWYWVWKMQGFPENGYQMLKDRMLHNLDQFDDIQKGMWNAYGEPSAEFTQAPSGSHQRRIQTIRHSIYDMFAEDASNHTINHAFELVKQQWRDFSLEFVAVNADPTSDSKGQGYDFHSNYNNARKLFFSYGEEDSVRGLITFAMNRISWGGQQSERGNEQMLLQYGEWAPQYFYNTYQKEARRHGALAKGYLSDDVDDDFGILAKSYKEERDAVLLYGLDYTDADSMSLAKTVWKAAWKQFKYMLAMNDVLFKAEAQLLKNAETAHIVEDLHRETIRYEYANAEFQLTPDTFWELFTAPSLEVMLHYSVNSYTDKPVEIRSPLAEAVIEHKQFKEAAEAATQVVEDVAPAGENISDLEASGEAEEAIEEITPEAQPAPAAEETTPAVDDSTPVPDAVAPATEDAAAAATTEGETTPAPAEGEATPAEGTEVPAAEAPATEGEAAPAEGSEVPAAVADTTVPEQPAQEAAATGEAAGV